MTMTQVSTPLTDIQARHCPRVECQPSLLPQSESCGTRPDNTSTTPVAILSEVVCSIVASRLDYCNAMLSGALAATFDKLQRAQNNLARVVCQSWGRIDARPLLHSLHWLPVRQQVTYKVALLTQKVQTTATPTYLSELVQTHASPRALHSSDAPLLVVPRIHTELARRAFSIAAPSTWNSLPADIRL